jgi:hypothetical protein
MAIYSDLARIFTTSFIRQLLSSKHLKFTQELSKQFSFVDEATKNSDYRLLFDSGYEILMENYRCEYIYKTEIYDNIKRKCKKQKKMGVLTEVRSGGSIADLLWLNGTSIAYEIKTEIDSNRRLLTQINSYSELFKEAMVVSHENNLKRIIEDLPSTVGIMYMDKSGALKVYRESIEYVENLNSELMFMTLRKNEYESAIREAFGDVPTVSDAYIYQECLNLFKTLSPLVAHDLMVKQLKKRGSINIEGSSSWPKSISFLLERGGLKRTEVKKIEGWLN